MSTSCLSQPPIVARVADSAVAPRLWRGNSNAIATIWLLGSLFCLTMACVMRVGDQRRVYLPGIAAPLPELCTTYSRFGLDCPGCGLTRTFIYMAHGQWQSAWRTSPVGMLVFLFACAQIPFALAQLVGRNRGRLVEAWGSWNDWCTAMLVAALCVQWLVKLAI